MQMDERNAVDDHDDVMERIQAYLRPVTVTREARALAEKVQQKMQRRLPADVYRAHRRAVRSCRRRQSRRTSEILRRIAEKYRAKHAWLFVPEGECMLRAAYSVRSELHNQRLLRDEKSIVTHVYGTQKCYVAQSTKDDPHYLPRRPETKSQLSAPVLSFGPHRQQVVIGVVDLEADEPGAFSSEDAANLTIDAQELAMGLLAQRGLDECDVARWPVDPIHDGWSPDRVVTELCQAFARGIQDGRRTDDLTVTVWHADWLTSCLWVLGTSGYDYEYRNQFLPFDSWTGRVTQAEKGVVMSGTPFDPSFREPEKAARMGVRHLMGCPVYGPKSGCRSVGAVSVALFSHDNREIFPTPAKLQELARVTGCVLADFDSRRTEMACVYLDHRMRESRRYAEPTNMVPAQMHVLRDVLQECFHADGVTIFGPDERRDNLTLITSTGVKDERVEWREGRWVILRQVGDSTVSLGGDPRRGVLKYLYRHPGTAVVVNSRAQLADLGQYYGAEFPSVALDNGLEHLTPDTPERRFMGIGIRRYAQSEVVVRIVRSKQSPPFTKADASLLETLTELCRQNEFWIPPMEDPSMLARDVNVLPVTSVPVNAGSRCEVVEEAQVVS